MPPSSEQLNLLNIPTLLKCCHSARWANDVFNQGPFDSNKNIMEAVEAAFERLEETDWLEAFKAHPQIGNISTLEQKYSSREISENEQKGVCVANQNIIIELLNLNQDYEAKHGFIFIVCASGKTAEEMLRILKKRVCNSRTEEMINASEEQKKITRLRLQILLKQDAVESV